MIYARYLGTPSASKSFKKVLSVQAAFTSVLWNRKSCTSAALINLGWKGGPTKNQSGLGIEAPSHLYPLGIVKSPNLNGLFNTYKLELGTGEQ